MAIFRKAHIAKDKDDLAVCLQDFHAALNGNTPSDTLALHFQNSVSDFQRDFVEIDTDRLNVAIDRLRVTVLALKKLKNKKQLPSAGR